jgi:hypothetical protein
VKSQQFHSGKGEVITLCGLQIRQNVIQLNQHMLFYRKNDNSGTASIYKKVWNKFVPLKVVIFVWQILQNRIPSKENLFKRGILTNAASICVGGCDSIESTSHLFFECPIAFNIWMNIFRWLGVISVLHNNSIVKFNAFCGVVQGNKRQQLGLSTVWFACLWSIWKARNAKIFQNKLISCSAIIEETKLLSWNWREALVTLLLSG